MDLPSEDSLRALVAHYAHLRAAFGEALGHPDLVEPNGKYFPDEFALEPASVLRLVRRTMTYAPLADDVGVELGFIEADDEGGGGGCGSGACGPGEGAKKIVSGAVVELPQGGYGLPLHVKDVGNPAILTAAIARAVGAIVLFEADEAVDPNARGVMSEIAAMATGLGLLLLNGSCVYMKGCGGLRAHQGTYLSVPELAVATALFCRVHDVKPGVVRSHLATTQSEAFDEAWRWADSQDEIVAKLRETPELLADGVFEFEAPRGIFGRLFSRRREPASAPMPIQKAAPARVRSEAEARRLAEMRALVEDALGTD